jgi:hypothetical protein
MKVIGVRQCIAVNPALEPLDNWKRRECFHR